VIERFAALPRGTDEDLELRLDLLLTDVLSEAARPDGALNGLLFLLGRSADDSLFFDVLHL
jgi:hypothetical protein